ncbi:tetratricopeptide repeat protein [Photobacterium profundum]|uniref:Sel1 repeat family protein n=1 Tax=Photobacterium profundum (strain SS9) TaxID=298386 RepID=Q6LLA2_PHOPR|nr:tetratricopeptide repeat protein [Photobacterium profundum]CAG21939.1 hypothetical protein PBPRB0066 [Photobacterium profundum SS9]
MPDFSMWLGLLGVPLIWGVVRYSFVVKKKEEQAKQQALKDERYRLVLEKAKIAEREEKMFKAQTGHVLSQLSLGKEYELTNIREALNWYNKAAVLDNDIGQNAMARLSRADIDDPDGEAKSLYWEAVVKAKRKNEEALFTLGKFLIQGSGVEPDIGAGIENVIASAEMEYVPAQLFLGDWYVAESNSLKEPHCAFSWRLRAAKNNDIKGFIKTAYCYQSGIGIEKNRIYAIYWLERAAEQGNSEAQYLAAQMHLGSNANDAAVAYIWFSIAYASGYKDAKKSRDEVVQHIGIESILNVQNVAKSIYKALRVQPVASHSLIDLLDQVYGRTGYQPTDEELNQIISDCTLSGNMLPEAEPTKEIVTDIPIIPMFAAESVKPSSVVTKSANVTTSAVVTKSGQVAEKNETATGQYQQQSWASSWDSLANETEEKAASK